MAARVPRGQEELCFTILLGTCSTTPNIQNFRCLDQHIDFYGSGAVLFVNLSQGAPKSKDKGDSLVKGPKAPATKKHHTDTFRLVKHVFDPVGTQLFVKMTSIEIDLCVLEPFRR